MRAGRPKKPTVDALLPLRLVGDFCSWQVDVPGLELMFSASLMGGKVLEFFLPLRLEEVVEFQVISSPLGFALRVYPKEEKELKEERLVTANEANGAVGGQDGHGRNFIVRDLKAQTLLLRLALGKRGRDGPPLAAQVCYAHDLKRPGPVVTISQGKVTINGQSEAWSSDLQCLRRSQLLPLRLVGKPCNWRLEQSGLVLAQGEVQGEWQCHSLCMRLLTREVEFQIVSDKLGFVWRAFPEGMSRRVPKGGAVEGLLGVLGGKDDGSGCNFLLTGKPMDVITVRVWLKYQGEHVHELRVSQGWEGGVPTVALGARRVQYPVAAQMTPLGPELLEAAETEEERKAALEQRNECLRRVACRLQQEYGHDDVQQEVLALRQLYPYQQKRSILALEMDGVAEEEEEEEDGVRCYVRAAQEMKSDRPKRADGDKEQPGAVANGEAPGPDEAVASPEELRQRCLRGLEAVQRQVAQHSEEGTSQSLALLPSMPSAMAGALSMCEGDALQAAMDGARKAHLEQLRKQERILEKALQPLEASDDEVEPQPPQTETSLALLQKENLFGNSDAQFNSAVQNLPSVKAARERAMQAEKLPVSVCALAVRMTELVHGVDPVARGANVLCLKRLRLLSTPHPAVTRQIAQALASPGYISGHPSSWFFGLEAVPQQFPEVLEELTAAFQAGRFAHWFGGPRAGRYLTCTLEELWSWGHLWTFDCVVQLQDQLRLVLEQMEDGANLSVESQVTISFHGKGQQLPPWDGARRARRVSLLFHPSYSHRRVAEGGALKLHSKDGKGGCLAESPGGGAYWAAFRTQELRQEVTKVSLACGRWCIAVHAEETVLAQRLRPSEGGESTAQAPCANCSFAAGDGVQLSCPGQHRLCRQCLLLELRRETVPSCPACAGEGDRIQLASVWELMSQEHPALEQLGCLCCPGAEGCDSQVDVYSEVVIFGQSKSSGLNGQRARALWWDVNHQVWEVILPSGRVLGLRPSELALVEACDGGSLVDCPSWQAGRGLYPVSLGNRCCVKLGIDECSGDAHCPVGYPYFHGAEYLPFDSLLTSLDAVLFFLRHDFQHFFHYNDMVEVHPPGLERIIFKNYRSWMHTFPHHHPQIDQGKLDRRIRRFRVLCRHSRDTRGARPLLFVRYVGDAPNEFTRIEELYSLLRLWGGADVRLCYVAMLQGKTWKAPRKAELCPSGPLGDAGIFAEDLTRGRLYRHAEHPKVLFWLVHGLVDVMDFSPIREALRFNVYDHAKLLRCPSITTKELLELVEPFKDPFTNKCGTCIRTWLERPVEREKEIELGFFPDCPRAQQPDQGRASNGCLRRAVQRLDLQAVRQLLEDSDANTWDPQGARPLHELCRAHGREALRLQIAGLLLLAKGDPRAKDRAGVSALALCQQTKQHRAEAPELLALLSACALEPYEPRDLFRALELLGPWQSQVSLNVLGLRPLRAVGPAEVKWRTPALQLEELLAQLEERLRRLRSQGPRQRRQLRRLLFEWHPDKNQHRLELATEVFQFLQLQKAKMKRES